MNKSELKTLIDRGLSTRQIAKELNKSQTTIRYQIKKHNLILKTAKYNSGGRKCSCDCGEIDSSKFYKNRKKTCITCHNKNKISSEKNNRTKIVNYMGGKCINCGWCLFQAGLQLHHVEPSHKDPNFKSHRGWSWDRIVKELKYCVLLCALCHIGIHTGNVILRNGNVAEMD